MPIQHGIRTSLQEKQKHISFVLSRLNSQPKITNSNESLLPLSITNGVWFRFIVDVYSCTMSGTTFKHCNSNTFIFYSRNEKLCSHHEYQVNASRCLLFDAKNCLCFDITHENEALVRCNAAFPLHTAQKITIFNVQWKLVYRAMKIIVFWFAKFFQKKIIIQKNEFLCIFNWIFQSSISPSNRRRNEIQRCEVAALVALKRENVKHRFSSSFRRRRIFRVNGDCQQKI